MVGPGDHSLNKAEPGFVDVVFSKPSLSFMKVNLCEQTLSVNTIFLETLRPRHSSPVVQKFSKSYCPCPPPKKRVEACGWDMTLALKLKSFLGIFPLSCKLKTG